jgi:hypothetical protein
MTRFLDVRLSPVGGDLATSVAIFQGTSISDYKSLDSGQLRSDILGRHVLIGIHGFNVNRADGIEHFSNWEGLLQLSPPSVFIGLLWPGDSIWAHGLDYPEEPRIANESGNLIAPFLDANFGIAASISFVSHSLGARILLQTISQMTLPVRRATLMAGAIDDDCLITEFKAAAANIAEISLLASRKDTVLSTLFPIGNLFAGIIAAGHPWWHSAIGQGGPCDPKPANLQSPFQIPDNWNFNHSNYLEIDPSPFPSVPLPTNVLPCGYAEPANGSRGWQEAWSAAFCSTRFR